MRKIKKSIEFPFFHANFSRFFFTFWREKIGVENAFFWREKTCREKNLACKSMYPQISDYQNRGFEAITSYLQKTIEF